MQTCQTGGPSAVGQSFDRAKKASAVCYFCDKLGHVKWDCAACKEWLEGQTASTASTTAAAAVESPTNGNDHCLCVLGGSGAGLVHVYVDVAEPQLHRDSWHHSRSVIDTGSTRTLVTVSLVNKLGISYHATEADDTVVALDGGPLPALRTVEQQFKRSDGPVSIPQTSVSALCFLNCLL